MRLSYCLELNTDFKSPLSGHSRNTATLLNFYNKPLCPLHYLHPLGDIYYGEREAKDKTV